MNSVPPQDPSPSGEQAPLDTPLSPPLRRPSRTRRVVWFVVMIVIGVLLLGGFYGFEQFKQKMMGQYFASMVPPPIPVATYETTTESVPVFLESIGTLTAVHQVVVAPELAGRIVALKFESGKDVKAGDVLVQLDDATERADLATFQAQARLSQLNLARAQQLAVKQFSSKQSVDEQKSLLDQANAGIAKSQAMIEHMVIRAPFDGRLGIRQVNLGQYVAPGDPVVTLTDLHELYIDFSLPEQDRASIRLGQKVDVRVDAYPDRVFNATLATIDPQVDPNTRAIKVRADLANTDHALQPGMYGRVSVVLPPQADVVTVPEPAIDYTVYGDSVYIVRDGKQKDKEGKPVLTVEQAFVTLGNRVGDKVAVLKGVKAGDRVVVGGQLKLHNGASVSLSDDKSLVNPKTLPTE